MSLQTGRYTAKECARILNISRSTFYRWLREGVIKVGKIDGRYNAGDLLKGMLKNLETQSDDNNNQYADKGNNL